jgi:hypothetical protein
MNRLPILAACLALTACAAITPPPNTQIALAKSEYALELAYSAADQAYLASEAALPVATKAQAKAILLQILDCPTPTTCTGYLHTARTALAASDATSLAAQVGEITTLAGEVTALAKH